MFLAVIQLLICTANQGGDGGDVIVFFYPKSHGNIKAIRFIIHGKLGYGNVDLVHQNTCLIQVHTRKEEKEFFPAPSADITFIFYLLPKKL